MCGAPQLPVLLRQEEESWVWPTGWHAIHGDSMQSRQQHAATPACSITCVHGMQWLELSSLLLLKPQTASLACLSGWGQASCLSVTLQEDTLFTQQSTTTAEVKVKRGSSVWTRTRAPRQG